MKFLFKLAYLSQITGAAMKKYIFSFLILFLSISVLYAQQRTAVVSDKGTFQSTISTESTDTLHYMVSPGVIYTATIGGQPAGYVNGTNGYFDTGKYQRLDFASDGVLGQAVILYFGAKEIVGTPDTINVVVRQVATNGAPGDLLASWPLSTADIDTTGPTVVGMSKQALNGLSVFVGIEWALTVDDKFALISNTDPNGATPSRVWERWDNGTFHQYGSATSWNLQIDLWVGMIYTQALGGPYWIPKGTNIRGFADLAEAITAVNTQGLAGETTFYIDADLDQSAAALPVLERNDISAGTPLLIKPSPGKTPTVTLTGSPGLDIVNTSYVTIDGSNQSDRTTRDMTFLMNSATGAGSGVIRVYNASTHVDIMNLNVKYETATAASRGILVDRATASTVSPSNIHIINNSIGTSDKAFSDGVALWGNDINIPVTDAVVADNIIYAGRRGITTFYVKDQFYFGNEVNITGQVANNVWHGAIYIAGGDGIIEIAGNKIISFAVNGTGYSGGILLNATYDVVNIYNNFIATNVTNVGTSTTNKVYGIVLNHFTQANPVNIMHNTILLPVTGLTGRHAAIGWERDTFADTSDFNIVNNIIVNHNDFAESYGIHWPWTGGIGESNYNNIFMSGSNGNIGYWNNAAVNNLAAWQTATSKDANSVSKTVTFVSNTDLHLAGASVGDIDLAGTPIPWITSDIDGDQRDPVTPYKGADESDPFVTDPVLFADDFDHPAGTLLTNVGWTAHSGAGTNALAVNPPSLSYTGYAGGGIGGAVELFGPSGEDVHKNFPQVTSGNLYAAMLVDVQAISTTGDYFFHLGPTTLGTTFRGRLFVKRDDDNNLAFGVAKAFNSEVVYGNFDYSMNTTHLVVMKYTFVPDGTDIISLYVNPQGSIEPTPLVTQTDAGTDAADIGSVALRQGGATTAPNLRLDAIRIGTDWEAVVGNPSVTPTVSTVWERSVAGTNLPDWFGLHLERGLAYGKVGANERVFVVSRTDYSKVRTLNALTGADVGILDTTGIAGGTFALNDVEASYDGVVFAANLTTNATTSPFKVYMWSSETSAPVVTVNYTSTDAVRLGDKFTVTGNYTAGTAQIWAASATAGIPKVYKWSMSGGIFNQTPEVITLSDNAAGGSASVGPLPNGEFYWNAVGNSARKYAANGTLIGTIPGEVIATGSNAIRYINTVGGAEYVMTYQYGAGNENARVVEVLGGVPENAITHVLTPSLGNAANANGAGDVSFKFNDDGTATLFVLATNNGVGAYKTSTVVPVELSAFEATVSGSAVTLNWTTITETNNSGFEVQRNISGEWINIGFITGKGTTTEVSRYSFADDLSNTNISGSIAYRLKQIDYDGTFAYSNEVLVDIDLMVSDFALLQNYPNPFNPNTNITYLIPTDTKVTLSVYSITGELVKELVNDFQNAGSYTVSFDAGNLASGMYIYRLVAGDFVKSHKMMLLK